GGYRVHDYLDYNPSRAEAQQRREAERAGRQAGRRARAGRGGRDLDGRFQSPAAGPGTDQQPAGGTAGDASDSSISTTLSNIPAAQLALSASFAPAPSRTRTREEKKSARLDGAPPADRRKETNPGI